MKEGSSNAKMTDEAKAVVVITGGRKYAEFFYLSVRHLTVIGRVLAKCCDLSVASSSCRSCGGLGQ